MIIDVNTSLGNWPFQKFQQNSAAGLAAHLRSEGISKALVSSIDAILFPDPGECNRELCALVASFPELIPVMTVNPTLSGWESDPAVIHAGAVKVFPGYHNYPLESGSMRTLAAGLAESGQPLMIQVRIEDERSHHPLCRVPPVDPDAIGRLAEDFPQLPIVCLCPYFGTAVELARARPNIYVDISMVEKLDTLNVLLEEVVPEQVLFGSHTPFLTPRSAVMKLNACTGEGGVKDKIAAGNAARVFGL